MKKLFHKAQQKRVYQDVVNQIQEAILDGEIEAGSKLPAERSLCEMFQTSRGTLREALRILEQKSLIEIRLGTNGGAYVRDVNGELMAENLAMLIHSKAVSLAHLAEFREGVEATVGGLAAQRATSVDCEELHGLLARAERFRDGGLEQWDSFVRVDEQIHTAIARIAGNPLYSFILKSVHDNIHRYYDKFLFVGSQELEENYQDLAAIITAICDHDSAAAASLSKGHVHRFAVYMKEKLR
ncbi:FadR/GntR family transcriptional regulator [Desulfogranum mediterraneum]|uniref:FadR/GntR family transcriptional regulator n=1 Tax=Desulfogranum mediterraneum TaxID=160661 RepID=UPI00040AE004|nr:FadR/GntR family transcriptional regulator [Desulfogranum mediterraneum]